MAEHNTLPQMTDEELSAEFVRRQASDPEAARPLLREFIARQQARAPVGHNGEFFKMLARLAKGKAAVSHG